MTPAEIQFAMKSNGYTQKRLADELGLASNTVSAVINGRGRSAGVEKRIAEITRRSLSALWPQWYRAGVAESPVEYLLGELSGDEVELLKNYRGLSAAQREQARAMLQILRLGMALGGSNVVIGAGGKTAGRDFIQGDRTKRRK